MRHGENLFTTWRDVDLENVATDIQHFHTKTMTERQVAMTARLTSVLETISAGAPDDPNVRVFGINNNVKRSFSAARKEAALQDVRFHDLRHTAATRLVGAHLPLTEVGRILGHTQANTTYRYVNANVETASVPPLLWMLSMTMVKLKTEPQPKNH